MKKILITGASGFLGWNICHLARQEWEVYGTYFSHQVKIPGTKTVKVDLRDFQTLKQIFNDIKPVAVIHSAAQSKPNWCQQNREEAYPINVTTTIDLAGLCVDRSIPFAFTSTDLVFDGLNPPYKETDPVCPINYYGEQKAIAEQKILELYPQSAICRMPLMFGIASPTNNSFIQPMLEALRKGRELRLFTDEFRTPVSASTAAAGLLLALEKVNGLLHLGGKERISRYQFGCLLAEVLQLPQDQLKQCQQKDVEMVAPRSPDVCLDSSKAFALGYQPLSLQKELETLQQEI